MRDYLEKVYKKSKNDYYKELSDCLKNNKKRFIITENPETIMLSQKNEELKRILLNENYSIVPDGIAIIKACKKLNINVTERITGVDISEYLLKECNNMNKSIYLFGASIEVINTLIKKINTEYPNIKILGFKNGYVNDKDEVFNSIIELKPDVCLVALGIPLQELLINKYIDQFDKGIFIGVGGSFDVLSGIKKRAPKIFIKLNLEWLYRIIKEPKRLKRFWNNNIKFLFKIK